MGPLLDKPSFPAEEAPTLKRAVIPEPSLLCPTCGGARVLRTGKFNRSDCPTCVGTGIVSREAFDAYINAHPLGKKKPPKTE